MENKSFLFLDFSIESYNKLGSVIFFKQKPKADKNWEKISIGKLVAIIIIRILKETKRLPKIVLFLLPNLLTIKELGIWSINLNIG